MIKNATKEQWNSAKIASLALIGGFASVLVENDRQLPVALQIVTGIAFGLFVIYETFRFIRRTF